MSETYSIVEVFPTLQGEGKWAGRRAVFCRFSGCNLWNGVPEDRHKGKGACAQWCDTKFTGGEKMTIKEILEKLSEAWGPSPYGAAEPHKRMVVFTGGEPTLQLDIDLVEAVQAAGWYVSVETNGTRDAIVLRAVDHVCVSPKKGSTLLVKKAHELKVVLPGGVDGSTDEHQWSRTELEALETYGEWGSMFVQPQDITDPRETEVTYLHAIAKGVPAKEILPLSIAYDAHMRLCLSWITEHPGWRLSLQGHKYIGLR